MLSYRHAFHAGNHADVLKHAVLVELCQYLTQKDKAFWVIDTHAGAGKYRLDSGQSAQLEEYRDGIGRLWERDDLPLLLTHYVALVRRFNPPKKLFVYPGSPSLALQLLREKDWLYLFEKHSTDVKMLAECFAAHSRQVRIGYTDGFGGLQSLLPPQPRRALVLIDPSYEEKSDYERVVMALKDSLKRFATGTYMLWYPELSRREAFELPGRLKRLGARWLHVALRVRTPASDGMGMHGSGLFIINPPWTLHGQLETLMPYLVKTLGQDGGAEFTLEKSVD